MKTFERKVEFIDKIETVELERSIAVRSYLPSSGRSFKFFISKQDADKIQDPFKFHEVERKYLYHDGKFGDALTQQGVSHKDIWKFFELYKDPIEASQDPHFSEDDLLWHYGSADLFYKLDAKNPTSYPYYCGYIGGVDNRSFNLKMAKEVLLKNPYVSKLEEISIPYYNCEAGRNRAIEFYYRYPQDLYEQVCNYYRDEMKEEFWTSRIRESIVWKPYHDKFDPLNLKACYIGEKE